MNKHRVKMFTLLIVVLMGVATAATQDAAPSAGVLTYAATSNQHPCSILLKSPRGITYRLSLLPDYDVEKRVVVLDLVLQQANKRNDDSNLFDPTGKLHGYQPYVFAASDFARGVQQSTYGELRRIELPKIGIQIQVRVTEAHVEPTSDRSTQRGRYQFDSLRLEITSTGLTPKGRSRLW